jgi:hypothetical protein
MFARHKHSRLFGCSIRNEEKRFLTLTPEGGKDSCQGDSGGPFINEATKVNLSDSRSVANSIKILFRVIYAAGT